MKFFKDCTTIAEVKTVYKTLAKLLHPDLGGSTAAMQELNNEYSFAIAKIAKGEGLSNDAINNIIIDNEAYRVVIESIIHIPEIIIELVGSWLWVSGNTFAAKSILKANNFMWASAKKMWFFRTEENKASNGGKSISISEIKSKYGSQRINTIGQYSIA